MNVISFLRWVNNLPAAALGANIPRSSSIRWPYDLLSCDWTRIDFGREVSIGRRAWISTHESGFIVLGEGSSIGRDAILSSAARITIGKNVLVSYRVSILDHHHDLWSDRAPTESGITRTAGITIGDGVFIGANSTILAGVSLGDRCRVAAGSVVTHSFPANVTVGGMPARILSSREG